MFSLKRTLIGAILAGIVLPLTFGGALLARLAYGPLSLGKVAHTLIGPLYIAQNGTVTRYAVHPAAQIFWKDVSLAWRCPKSLASFWKAGGGALILKAEGVRIQGNDGKVPLLISQAVLSASFLPLFRGEVDPLEFSTGGDRLFLKQTETGVILDLPLQRIKKRPPRNWDFLHLATLRQASLHGVEVHLASLPKGRLKGLAASLALTDVEMAHEAGRPPDTGWTGKGAADLAAGESRGRMQFRSESETQWGATASLLDAWQLSPLWKQLGRLHFPLSLKLAGDIPSCLANRNCALAYDLSAGKGQFFQPTAPPLELESMKGDGKVSWKPGFRDFGAELSVGRIALWDSDHVLTPGEAVASLSADNILRAQNIHMDLHAKIPLLNFSTLISVWPEGAMKGARRWMTANMTYGLGKNLDIHAGFESDSGWSNLNVPVLEGTLEGHDLTVYWLRPIQPVTNIEAQAKFEGPEIVRIDLQHGRMQADGRGYIHVPSGSVTITGLMMRNQIGDVDLKLAGSFPAFMDVLTKKRLNLFSRFDKPYRNLTGNLDAHLFVSLPLVTWVTLDQVWIDSHVSLLNCGMDWDHFGPIREINGLLHADSNGLEGDTTSRIRGIPVSLKAMDNFNLTTIGQMMRHIQIGARLSENALAQAGVHLPGGLLRGEATLSADLLQKWLGRGDNKTDIDLLLDMEHAGIHSLLWKKPQGLQASVQAHVGLRQTHLTALDHLRAKGPELALEGRGLMAGHRITGLEISRFRLGGNEGKFLARWPGRDFSHPAEGMPESYEMWLEAQSLDFMPLITALGNNPEKRKPPSRADWFQLPKGRWKVTARAEKAFVLPGKALLGLNARALWENRKIQEAHFSVRSPYPVQGDLGPVDPGSGTQDFGFKMMQVGDWLRWLGLYPSLQGGDFSAAGKVRGDGIGTGKAMPGFDGQMVLKQLALRDPPASLKAATFFAPLHWGQLRDDVFGGIEMKSAVQMRDNVVHLRQMEASNAMLGGTLEGSIDLRSHRLDLKGTLAPFFCINGLPGKLPGWVGRAFAPQPGSGMFSATYKVGGLLEKPEISPNLFALFLPGILRELAGY